MVSSEDSSVAYIRAILFGPSPAEPFGGDAEASLDRRAEDVAQVILLGNNPRAIGGEIVQYCRKLMNQLADASGQSDAELMGWQMEWPGTLHAIARALLDRKRKNSDLDAVSFSTALNSTVVAASQPLLNPNLRQFILRYSSASPVASSTPEATDKISSGDDGSPSYMSITPKVLLGNAWVLRETAAIFATAAVDRTGRDCMLALSLRPLRKKHLRSIKDYGHLIGDIHGQQAAVAAWLEQEQEQRRKAGQAALSPVESVQRQQQLDGHLQRELGTVQRDLDDMASRWAHRRAGKKDIPCVARMSVLSNLGSCGGLVALHCPLARMVSVLAGEGDEAKEAGTGSSPISVGRLGIASAEGGGAAGGGGGAVEAKAMTARPGAPLGITPPLRPVHTVSLGGAASKGGKAAAEPVTVDVKPSDGMDLQGVAAACVSAARTGLRAFTVWRDAWTDATVQEAIVPFARAFADLVQIIPAPVIAKQYLSIEEVLERIHACLGEFLPSEDLGALVEGASLSVCIATLQHGTMTARVYGADGLSRLCVGSNQRQRRIEEIGVDKVNLERTTELQAKPASAERLPVGEKQTLFLLPEDLQSQFVESNVLDELFGSRAHGRLLRKLGLVLAWAVRLQHQYWRKTAARAETDEDAMPSLTAVVSLATESSAGIREGATECLQAALSDGVPPYAVRAIITRVLHVERLAMKRVGLKEFAHLPSGGLSVGAVRMLIRCLETAFEHAYEDSLISGASEVVRGILSLLADPCSTGPVESMPLAFTSGVGATCCGIPTVLVRDSAPTFARRFSCPTTELLDDLASALVKGCTSTSAGWILRGTIIRCMLDNVLQGASLPHSLIVMDRLLEVQAADVEGMLNYATVLEVCAEDKRQSELHWQYAEMDEEGKAISASPKFPDGDTLRERRQDEDEYLRSHCKLEGYSWAASCWRPVSDSAISLPMLGGGVPFACRAVVGALKSYMHAARASLWRRAATILQLSSEEHRASVLERARAFPTVQPLPEQVSSDDVVAGSATEIDMDDRNLAALCVCLDLMGDDTLLASRFSHKSVVVRLLETLGRLFASTTVGLRYGYVGSGASSVALPFAVLQELWEELVVRPCHPSDSVVLFEWFATCVVVPARARDAVCLYIYTGEVLPEAVPAASGAGASPGASSSADTRTDEDLLKLVLLSCAKMLRSTAGYDKSLVDESGVQNEYMQKRINSCAGLAVHIFKAVNARECRLVQLPLLHPKGEAASRTVWDRGLLERVSSGGETKSLGLGDDWVVSSDPSELWGIEMMWYSSDTKLGAALVDCYIHAFPRLLELLLGLGEYSSTPSSVFGRAAAVQACLRQTEPQTERFLTQVFVDKCSGSAKEDGAAADADAMPASGAGADERPGVQPANGQAGVLIQEAMLRSERWCAMIERSLQYHAYKYDHVLERAKSASSGSFLAYASQTKTADSPDRVNVLLLDRFYACAQYYTEAQAQYLATVTVALTLDTSIGDLRSKLVTELAVSSAADVILLLDDRRCTDIDSVPVADLGLTSTSTIVAMSQMYEVANFEYIGGKEDVQQPTKPPTTGALAEACCMNGLTRLEPFGSAFGRLESFHSFLLAGAHSGDCAQSSSMWACMQSASVSPAILHTIAQMVHEIAVRGIETSPVQVRALLRGDWAPDGLKESPFATASAARGLELWISGVAASVSQSYFKAFSGRTDDLDRDDLLALQPIRTVVALAAVVSFRESISMVHATTDGSVKPADTHLRKSAISDSLEQLFRWRELISNPGFVEFLLAELLDQVKKGLSRMVEARNGKSGASEREALADSVRRLVNVIITCLAFIKKPTQEWDSLLSVKKSLYWRDIAVCGRQQSYTAHWTIQEAALGCSIALLTMKTNSFLSYSERWCVTSGCVLLGAVLRYVYELVQPCQCETSRECLPRSLRKKETWIDSNLRGANTPMLFRYGFLDLVHACMSSGSCCAEDCAVLGSSCYFVAVMAQDSLSKQLKLCSYEFELRNAQLSQVKGSRLADAGRVARLAVAVSQLDQYQRRLSEVKSPLVYILEFGISSIDAVVRASSTGRLDRTRAQFVIPAMGRLVLRCATDLCACGIAEANGEAWVATAKTWIEAASRGLCSVGVASVARGQTGSRTTTFETCNLLPSSVRAKHEKGRGDIKCMAPVEVLAAPATDQPAIVIGSRHSDLPYEVVKRLHYARLRAPNVEPLGVGRCAPAILGSGLFGTRALVDCDTSVLLTGASQSPGALQGLELSPTNSVAPRAKSQALLSILVPRTLTDDLFHSEYTSASLRKLCLAHDPCRPGSSATASRRRPVWFFEEGQSLPAVVAPDGADIVALSGLFTSVGGPSNAASILASNTGGYLDGAASAREAAALRWRNEVRIEGKKNFAPLVSEESLGTLLSAGSLAFSFLEDDPLAATKAIAASEIGGYDSRVRIAALSLLRRVGLVGTRRETNKTSFHTDEYERIQGPWQYEALLCIATGVLRVVGRGKQLAVSATLGFSTAAECHRIRVEEDILLRSALYRVLWPSADTLKGITFSIGITSSAAGFSVADCLAGGKLQRSIGRLACSYLLQCAVELSISRIAPFASSRASVEAARFGAHAIMPFLLFDIRKESLSEDDIRYFREHGSTSRSENIRLPFEVIRYRLGKQFETGQVSAMITTILGSLPSDEMVLRAVEGRSSTAKQALDLQVSLSRDLCRTVCELLEDCRDTYAASSDSEDLGTVLDAPMRMASLPIAGIENPGCVCYAIATLYLLCHVPQFERAVMRVRPHPLVSADKGSQEAKPAGLLHAPMVAELYRLFALLRHGDMGAVSIRPFAASFLDQQGNPIRIGKQQDASEFLSGLLDRVDDVMEMAEGSSRPAMDAAVSSSGVAAGEFRYMIIKNLFGSVLKSPVYTPANPKGSESEEYYHSVLQVHLSAGKENLRDALASTFYDEVLDGDDRYLCPVSNKKVRAVKRTVLHRTSPYLFVQLLRFDFNVTTHTREKLNTPLYFPVDDVLDLSEHFDAANSSKGSDSPSQESAASDQSQQYRLYGVVVHTGTAYGGHYYSFVRNVDGIRESEATYPKRGDPAYSGSEIPRTNVPEWIKLNDSRVSPATAEEVKRDGFGSHEGDSTDGKSAYLLLYRRVGDLSTSGASIASTTQPSSADSARKGEMHSAAIQRYVETQNKRYWAGYSLYDPLLGRSIIQSLLSACSIAQGYRAAKASRLAVRDQIAAKHDEKLNGALSSDALTAYSQLHPGFHVSSAETEKCALGAGLSWAEAQAASDHFDSDGGSSIDAQLLPAQRQGEPASGAGESHQAVELLPGVDLPPAHTACFAVGKSALMYLVHVATRRFSHYHAAVHIGHKLGRLTDSMPILAAWIANYLSARPSVLRRLLLHPDTVVRRLSASMLARCCKCLQVHFQQEHEEDERQLIASSSGGKYAEDDPALRDAYADGAATSGVDRMSASEFASPLTSICGAIAQVALVDARECCSRWHEAQWLLADLASSSALWSARLLAALGGCTLSLDIVAGHLSPLSHQLPADVSESQMPWLLKGLDLRSLERLEEYQLAGANITGYIVTVMSLLKYIYLPGETQRREWADRIAAKHEKDHSFSQQAHMAFTSLFTGMQSTGGDAGSGGGGASSVAGASREDCGPTSTNRSASDCLADAIAPVQSYEVRELVSAMSASNPSVDEVMAQGFHHEEKAQQAKEWAKTMREVSCRWWSARPTRDNAPAVSAAGLLLLQDKGTMRWLMTLVVHGQQRARACLDGAAGYRFTVPIPQYSCWSLRNDARVKSREKTTSTVGNRFKDREVAPYIDHVTGLGLDPVPMRILVGNHSAAIQVLCYGNKIQSVCMYETLMTQLVSYTSKVDIGRCVQLLFQLLSVSDHLVESRMQELFLNETCGVMETLAVLQRQMNVVGVYQVLLLMRSLFGATDKNGKLLSFARTAVREQQRLIPDWINVNDAYIQWCYTAIAAARSTSATDSPGSGSGAEIAAAAALLAGARGAYQAGLGHGEPATGALAEPDSSGTPADASGGVSGVAAGGGGGGGGGGREAWTAGASESKTGDGGGEEEGAGGGGGQEGGASASDVDYALEAALVDLGITPEHAPERGAGGGGGQASGGGAAEAGASPGTSQEISGAGSAGEADAAADAEEEELLAAIAASLGEQ